MSNGDKWHVEKVRFKSGWRQIGDVADLELRWNGKAVPISIKFVTPTEFLGPDIEIKGKSYLEILLALQTVPVEPAIREWLLSRWNLIQKLSQHVDQSHWKRGTTTPPSAYAALAHLYEIFVSEKVKDVVTELQFIMNTPTREAAAMRIKTARSRDFLTSPSRGVTDGKATSLSQKTLPCSWVSDYYR